MKLQKQLSRKVRDKKYPKYTVVIPPKQIDELGWKEKQDLKGKVDGKKLILEPE